MKALVGLVLGACLVAPAMANRELAKRSNCMGCHAVDRKILGPALQDVAKRYQGQGDAQMRLAQSIKRGGQGKWGAVAMPTQESLSEADANALAKWVLAGAK